MSFKVDICNFYWDHRTWRSWRSRNETRYMNSHTQISTELRQCYRIFWPRLFVGNWDKEKPMILCARSTSRCKKNRKRSNLSKICLTSIQSTETFFDYQTMAGTIVWEIQEACKGLWDCSFWLYFSDTDWLGKQTAVTWTLLGSFKVTKKQN